MSTQTQIGIIGAGPAGLTLALLLQRAGIDCIILESRNRTYVESRVRAGLLEQNTVDLLKELGAGERMLKEGLIHHGVNLSFDGERIRVPFDELTGGRCITIYGQQEVVKDLIKTCLDRNISIHFEAEVTSIHGIDSKKPTVTYRHNRKEISLESDFIAGCDGFHGISKKTLPKDTYKEYQIEYPFSWLGILANVAPSSDELVYAYHENGFALHSLRSEKVSRLYLQIDNDDTLMNWSDGRCNQDRSLKKPSRPCEVT
jgi:p-hydroxybenzoate 3-monooxygenase